MKLDQEDVARVYQIFVDYGIDTHLIAQQVEISRRRAQQLAKDYRDNSEIPQLETPGRKPYAEYPDDPEQRVHYLRQRRGAGAEAIAHVLRSTDGLSIATNRVHDILLEYEHVTENPNKQGRKRPWIRFEPEYASVTVHMDWYHNKHDQQVLAVEDDASRRVFHMIETDSTSASQSVELLDSIWEELKSPVLILEVITDHGWEFINTHQDERPYLDHKSECYLHENDIKHTLRKVGRPSQMARSSDSSRPPTNTAGGLELFPNSSPSTTRSDHT